MTVNVQLFSMLREAAGTSRLEIEIEADSSGIDLLQSIRERYPDLSQYLSSVRLAVNERYVKDDVVISDGDDVAIITPVSGG